MFPESVFKLSDNTLSRHSRKANRQVAAVYVHMLAVNQVVPGTTSEQRQFMLDRRANWAAPLGGRNEGGGVLKLV